MNKIGTVFILAGFLFSACERDDPDPYEANRLVKETTYYETTGGEVQGFVDYTYDTRGNLILKNRNDLLFTAYEYDHLDRLIRDAELRDGQPMVSTYYNYLSELSTHEIRIGQEGDTLHVKHLQYNSRQQLINEKFYQYPVIYRNNDEVLRLTRDKSYLYDGNVLQLTVEHQLSYRNNDPERPTYFLKTYFDVYGNKYLEEMKDSDGEFLRQMKYVNQYDGALLTASYRSDLPEYSYVGYTYDEQGRIIRTVDYQGRLTSERFYRNETLAELHEFTPDGYDNIPDFKTIKVFEYD